MKATVNENKPTDGGHRKLFTGVANAFITALNPTQEELKEMGYRAEKAPDYRVIDNDSKEVVGIRLAFFLEFNFQEEVHKTVLNLRLRKEFMESNKDPENPRSNYIDQFGKTSFLSESEKASQQMAAKYHWMDFKSLKKAVKGQPELIEFLRSYAGSKQTDPMELEPADMRSIFAGDMSPIKKAVLQKGMENENAARVLLGVREKDGKFFQQVYDRKFDFPWSYTSKYIHKSLVDNASHLGSGVSYGNFSDNFVESEFDLREFDQSASSPAPVSNAANAADLIGAGVAAVADDAFGAPEQDDLPF